ncbi:ABC transporter permease [Phytoactinopolyspora halotolerans]|uniref:ABC transporter permease subunit n=1 Tax=Phytoactinopolyspora halotolerans TaxID=1981512 RepID=A0A6L9S4P4_9ACTN|nr:ABC transporter permease [Phytoactinopolyspora halotolerans]NED98999.1 ABC transporter permease subunit [Phytoactinopolyspora halotolerans]
MIDALRFESTRIRTLRSTYWLLGLGIVLSAGIGLTVAIATRNDTLDDQTVITVLTGGGEFATFLPIFVAIIGVFATGHEYRHGTIQPTLLAIPQRSTLLLSKIVIVLVTAAVATVVSVAINYGIGMIFWDEAPELGSSPLNEAVPGYVVMVMIYGLLGIALAQLFRGVPSAIVVLLVTPLIVESLISGLSMVDALDWLQPALKFLPFSAGARLVAVEPYDPAGGPDFDFFDRWVSGGVFAGFAVIILIIAWALFKKRDA